MIIADIHSHILPGVDDGSQSFEQSMDMLMEAYKNGTRHIIATPHFGSRNYFVQKDTAVELADKLNRELALRDVNLTVYPGNEIRCTTESPDIIKEQIVCSLNQKRYLLVELPFTHPCIDIIKLILSCPHEGNTLILAHPERYPYLIHDFSMYEQLTAKGILLQCNADSLMGKAGLSAKRVSHKLMRKGMVAFVASDCHSLRERTPNVSEAYALVSRIYGETTAENVFFKNPMRVIEDKIITK